MKRKTIIILRSNPVEPDSRVEKEANCLIKFGYNVTIVAWDRSSNYRINESFLELTNGKTPIVRFGIIASYGEGMKNLKAFIKFQLQLAIWLIKNRKHYNVIHACDFDTAFTAYFYTRLLRKTLVFDIFDYLYSQKRDELNMFQKCIVLCQNRIINEAHGTIICTEERREQIAGTTPKRLVVIHNSPPQPTECLRPLALNKDKVKIVYVGILQEHRLIKELAKVVRKNAKWELHIAGFGKHEDYFIQLSKRYNNILYYGKISYSRALELENSCDIMTAIYDPLIENHYYAAPNKFYEALMLGKPLIMVRDTGMSNVVENNNIGELIDYNIASLENAICNLVRRKNEWPAISKRMKKLYNEQYDWTAMEKRLKEFYLEVLKD